MEILEDNVWSASPWQSALSDQSYTTRCPKKKCELLLVIEAVIHTFFWDTL